MRSGTWRTLQRAASGFIRTYGIALATCVTALSQVHQTGPQVLTFFSAIDDSDQPYGLYLPKTYDPSKKWPLVISLHGAYSNHRLNLRRVLGQGNRPGETDAEASRYFPRLKDVDFIVATPLARGTMGYQGIAERDVYDVLAEVKSRFSIDDDRIYLTGLSMGGGGALWLGLTKPDIWAAIASVCPYPPSEAGELTGNAVNVPVKLFQGALDPVVKAESVRQWHKRLLEGGVQADYVEYPNVRHNAWDFAYKDGAIFDWFKQFHRVRHPQRVQFTALDYSHASAYWVRFDSLTPGTPARIDARLSGANTLEIATKNLDGFTLLLRQHPMVSAKRVLSLTVDGQKLRPKLAESISLSRTPKGWLLRRSSLSSGKKRPGAEGPMADALATKHVYVYGTLDAPPPEEVERRRAQATFASEWSLPRSRLLLTFRVLADMELKDADIKSSNLVLFGTRETNSVIARLSPKLPVALNPGAADYSLTFVYPVDGRYVVVNSGLPWWTRFDQAPRPGLPFSAPVYRSMQSFGDFILFRGGLENVIVEGRFTKGWKVPIEAAQRLRSTGAIEVQQSEVQPNEAQPSKVQQ